jgi:methylase of polypeptide subunit release factors
MNSNPAGEAVRQGVVCDVKKTALFALADALQSVHYRFVTCTPATHATVNRRALNQWAASPADIYGWNRPYKESNEHARWHMLNQQAGIAVADGAGWRSRLRVSSLYGRYYFHSGFPTDLQDAVFFGPDTYRFIHALKARLSGMVGVYRALDIGCGTGAAAIAIAHAFPLSEVIASDINPGALALTEINAGLAGTSNVNACHSDLYHDVSGTFDLIVANPPYLNDKEQRCYRHGGGDYGEALSVAIVAGALERLNDGGSLFLYTGAAIVNGEDTLLEALRPLLGGSGFRWTYEELDPDVFGEELAHEHYAEVDRIAVVWLVISKAGETMPAAEVRNASS